MESITSTFEMRFTQLYWSRDRILGLIYAINLVTSNTQFFLDIFQIFGTRHLLHKHLLPTIVKVLMLWICRIWNESAVFDWLETYALCSYWGVQNRAEKLMMNGIRQVHYDHLNTIAEEVLTCLDKPCGLRHCRNLAVATILFHILMRACSLTIQIVLLTHRNAFCWLDEWFVLTFEEVLFHTFWAST